MNSSYSFLAIGQTHQSSESFGDFKRYVGIGASQILAVNPSKEELGKLYGREVAEPQYTGEQDGVETVRIDFIVKTVPELNDGIDVINKVSFFLRNTAAARSFTNSEGKEVKLLTVIDRYGNSANASAEDAKAGKRLTYTGKDNMVHLQKIDAKYRVAWEGEAQLVAFLHTFLGIRDAFTYEKNEWLLRDGEDLDIYTLQLEHVKDYFKGDFSELREAIALQPNNKIYLTYGVKSTESGQFQVISTDPQLMFGYVNDKVLKRAEDRLIFLYRNPESSFSQKFTYKVCPLQEYSVEATNLEQPYSYGDTPQSGNPGVVLDDLPADDAPKMPWE